MGDMRGLIEAVEYGNEAAAKLNAKQMMPNHAANMGRAFNGSLDAAKALHDALLPGWWATLRLSTRPMVTVGYLDAVSEGQDDSLARAWLLAILRALEEVDTPNTRAKIDSEDRKEGA